jgi:hypothetical protein
VVEQRQFCRGIESHGNADIKCEPLHFSS